MFNVDTLFLTLFIQSLFIQSLFIKSLFIQSLFIQSLTECFLSILVWLARIEIQYSVIQKKYITHYFQHQVFVCDGIDFQSILVSRNIATLCHSQNKSKTH
jgi:hypothetical protein